MEKEAFNREIEICKNLSKENGGGCNWGRCVDCGVIPLLYKLGKGERYGDEDRIRGLKGSVLDDGEGKFES